jgi:hypothetical protein
MKNSRAHTKRRRRRCACKTGCNHSNRFRSGLLGSFANSPLFIYVHAPDNFRASRLGWQFRIHQRLVIKIKESRAEMQIKKVKGDKGEKKNSISGAPQKNGPDALSLSL